MGRNEMSVREDADLGKEIEEFHAEVSETDDDQLLDDTESTQEPTSDAPDDGDAKDEARASADAGEGDDAREGATDADTDEGRQAEPDADAMAAKAESQEIDRSSPTKDRRYKALDGNYYSWVELEELGLAQDVITNAHQSKHFQDLYRKKVAGKETEGETVEGREGEQPRQLTHEERQQLADRRVEAFAPALKDFVAAGEIEEELADFAPRFLSHMTSERQLLMKILWEGGEVGDKKLPPLVPAVFAMWDRYQESTQASEAEQNVQEVTNQVSSSLSELAGKGYDALKTEDHQIEFLEWMVSEEGAALGEEAFGLKGQALEGLYLAYLQSGKAKAEGKARTTPNADAMSRSPGSGTSASRSRPAPGTEEAAIAAFAKDLGT